jgi:hypothetical protein
MSIGYYALVRLANVVPGDPQVILRLPSIIGYLLSLVEVYCFARKRLPIAAGLTAVLMMTLSPFRTYAVEARSYSLMVGSLAIAAVFWQRIGERQFMTPLFALLLTLAVASHNLAVVTISCFGVAELAATVLARRIRWGVWFACLLATSPFFLSLPLLMHLRDIYGQYFWAQPDWRTVFSTYKDFLGVNLGIFPIVLILFLGLIVTNAFVRMLGQPGQRLGESGFSLPEILLVSGFLLYPALLVVLTKAAGGGYTPRYGWPVIFGLALGSVYLIHIIWRKPFSAYLLIALLIAFAARDSNEFRRFYKDGSTRADPRWTRLSELSSSEPNVPVVISTLYMEAVEYAPRELRDRLVRVVDPNASRRILGFDTSDMNFNLLAQFIPLRVEDLVQFEGARHRFLLYSGGGVDWITQYLVTEKYCLRLLSHENFEYSIYLVERSCLD